MTPTRSTPMISDDTLALCCLERRLKAPVSVRDWPEHGATAVWSHPDGYAFSWGTVVERARGALLVWDFHLDRIREDFETRGLSAGALRERVFRECERRLDCTLRDNVIGGEPLAADPAGWRVIPGTLGQPHPISVVCHVAAARDARGWLVTEFIPEILPWLQQAVRDEFLA
jgi:hypothetical protein